MQHHKSNPVGQALLDERCEFPFPFGGGAIVQGNRAILVLQQQTGPFLHKISEFGTQFVEIVPRAGIFVGSKQDSAALGRLADVDAVHNWLDALLAKLECKDGLHNG
jgi:hypothetical protein